MTLTRPTAAPRAAGPAAPLRYTVADTMAAVRPFAASALVSDPAWAAALAVAARIPAAAVSGFYLECRLARGDGPVDWIARVDATGREILAGRNPRVRVPREVAWTAGWAPVARFCTRWGDDPLLRAAVRDLWLEFDLDGGGFPAPSVFVALEAGVVGGFADDEWRALLDRVMDELAAGHAAAADRAALLAALRARPAGAGVPYLGFLLARPLQPTRLYLSGVEGAAIPAAFGALGWPGDRAELAHAIARVDGGTAPPVGMAHVDFAGGQALARVGVELTLERRGQLRGRLREAAFLDQLVEIGLCTADQRAGMEAWPGHSVGVLPHELWRSVTARRVNCVKLDHVPGREARVKAYLLARWSPAPAAAGRRGMAD